MFLRIFKSNSVYNFFLVPLTGILLLLGSFLHPESLPRAIVPFSLPFPVPEVPGTIAVWINFGLILILCFQLLFINARYSFVRARTFLPAYLFLFIVLALPDLHTVQPVFISAVFLIQAIKRTFDAYEAGKAHSHAFDAGFFTGLAGLFYLPANLFVLLIPVNIYTIKAKNGWREFVTPFVGVLLPWTFTVSAYYIFSDPAILLSLLKEQFIRNESSILLQWPVRTYFIYLIIITLISSVFIITQYDEKKISTRRYFKILFFYFVSSLIFFIFRPVSFEILVILALPLSFLITNYLTFMRRRIWAELFFTILILISVSLQFFY
ncbi:MAG TPA: DUF6427 family protein [Prolixibacteraceae bacterium]|nr:DUF6427 family protein [Prolixibacteraceae bacterium]